MPPVAGLVWTAGRAHVMLSPMGRVRRLPLLFIGLAGCYTSSGSEPAEGEVVDAQQDDGAEDSARDVPDEADVGRDVATEGDAEAWMPDGDPCVVDEDCDDGDHCNGVEMCVRGTGCVPGTPPDCDDGIACTRDSCELASGECRSVADDALCLPPMICVPSVGCCDRLMGCPERCVADPDCDDGEPCNGSETCGPDGLCLPGTAPAEVCNGVDDDCDTAVDDGFDCIPGVFVSCTTVCGSTGWGRCNSACTRPAPADCIPPIETCNAGDDDCDTMTDETYYCIAGGTVTCYDRCGGVGTGVCTADCTDPAPAGCVSPPESCNGRDDDCDGLVDEECGPECCTDRGDNDADGAVDCDDADCLDDPACTPCRVGPEICWDGCDNDLDCRTDDDDPEDCPCPHACSRCNCRPGSESCDNRCDDDRDGAIDCEDPDCAGVGRCAGCVPTAAAEDSFALCMNGRDDDCDGWTDACDEPVCARMTPGCDVPWAEQCGNGLDEDLDGMTDCSDWDCRCWIGCTGIEWTPENCDNGVDDDWDGRTDADDFDCPHACP